jgi:hypothetical protein
MLTKVLEVTSIQLEILKKQPPILSVVVEGIVGSPGWKKARLVPYVYVKPPGNGIYEFDLVALCPTIITIQKLTSIKAAGQWQDYPPDLKGVKVYASTNCDEKMLSDATKQASLAEGGGSGNPKGLFVNQ